MLRHLKMYYLFVSLPFVMLLVGATIFFDAIRSTLDRNPHPQINYTIFVIILVGGLIILMNAKRLMGEARALVDFSRAIHAKTASAALREMANNFRCDIACLLQMIATSCDRSISHQEQAALEHELANVHSRLNRRNALPSYLTGLLVGMGLLGTFIGLLATLGDIGALIGSFSDLDMSAADPIVVFSNMIEKMKAPMQSMAIAFSASMFGLLGSIILGLMMVGIKRFQGDIFSVLSSELARHIEVALSFESITFRTPDAAIGCYDQANDLTASVLLRIEERLTEAARIRQRALTAEIDDFKTQRADMLRALTEQTEANNGFRAELQKLGSQLGTLLTSLEQRNNAVSGQLSDLAVNLAGEGRETHKLLAAQVEEQKRLIDRLDAFNIEERLGESVRNQQRMIGAVIDDFKHQREETLQALTVQNENGRSFNAELQQLNGQMSEIFSSMERSGSEISSQLSELTVQAGSAAKETHRLLNVTNSSVRSDLQQLGSRLQGQLGEDSEKLEQLLATLASQSENGAQQIAARIVELAERQAEGDDKAREQLEGAGEALQGELQQLGKQLSALFQAVEAGGGELAKQVAELMHRRSSDAKTSHELLSKLLGSMPGLQVSEQEA